MIAGGVAGAAIGAGAGALSSLLNSTTQSYETEFVNMETKVIGQVPQGEVFYVPNDGNNQPPANAEAVADLMDGNIDKLARRGWRQTEDLRPTDVEAQVPERTILGNVKVRTEDKEITVGAGMVSSIVGGAAVGAVTGVAGGILVNVLRKTL
jgi:archaellum component FlaG (FlaF/FlaG flagellin family)